MVAIKVDIYKVKEIERYSVSLPKKLDKEISKESKSFMGRVMNSAKRRAPVDTGGLKESIKLQPVKQGKNVKIWKLVVGSPYAAFQEEGFKPHSFFAGGALNSSKLAPGIVYRVSKWTPFIKPALDIQLSSFSQKLNNAVGRAMK